MSRFLKVLACTIALASILSLNGCSSGSATPPNASGTLTGGVTPKQGTLTSDVTGTGANQTVQATVNGVATTVTIPATFLPVGTTLTAGTPFLVIPAGSQPIKLAGTTTFNAGIGTTQAAADADLAAGGSVNVGADGKISVDTAIPLNQPAAAAGSRAVTAIALALPAGNVATRDLNYQKLTILTQTTTVRLNNGTVQTISGFASLVSGTIPNNGEKSNAVIHIQMDPELSQRVMTLIVDYVNGDRSTTNGTVQADGTCTFLGFGNHNIPNNGVQAITLVM